MSEYEQIMENADRAISLATDMASQIASSEISSISNRLDYAQLLATLAVGHQLVALRVSLAD